MNQLVNYPIQYIQNLKLNLVTGVYLNKKIKYTYVKYFLLIYVSQCAILKNYNIGLFLFKSSVLLFIKSVN